MGELERRAMEFAYRCHNAIDQKRRYTEEPYINHVKSVVDLVRSVQHTEEMLCAAWLHDVVEDTDATLNEIGQQFGAEVAALVNMLTDVSMMTDGNRAARKAIDREHAALACPAAKTIKIADLIDNARNIKQRDPAFAKVYLAEKALLLDVLRDGDKYLWESAFKLLTLE